MTKKEVEEKYQKGFECIKLFEELSQKQEDVFQIHIERLQALQFLLARLEELKVKELAEVMTADRESKAISELVTKSE